MTQHSTGLPVSSPLPLEGTFNTRDLGGYPTSTGALTRSHVFLRSDGLSALTDSDIRYLSDYGVRCIIDLRTEEEVHSSPCPIGSEYQIRYHHVPLADSLSPESLAASDEGRMADLYTALLDHASHTIVRIMRLFLAYRSHVTLFHCAAGKDRTGVISMLLLLLAGVPRDHVVVDYAASAANLAPLFQHLISQLAGQGLTVPDFALASDAEDMALTISYLERTWGAAGQYLLEAGMTEEEISRLRAMLNPA